jgi:hypothetical protein
LVGIFAVCGYPAAAAGAQARAQPGGAVIINLAMRTRLQAMAT